MKNALGGGATEYLELSLASNEKCMNLSRVYVAQR